MNFFVIGTCSMSVKEEVYTYLFDLETMEPQTFVIKYVSKVRMFFWLILIPGDV